MRILAQVAWEHDTGLPEDRMVNTWHFDAVDLAEIPEVQAALNSFYNDAVEGGNRITGYYSRNLSGAGTVRYYDVDAPVPRIPLAVLPIGFTVPTTGESLPSEVAVVLSFHAAMVSGEPPARRRGRVYLGPFRVDALAPDGRPVGDLMGIIRGAADRLRLEAIANGTPWSVYSTVDDVMRPVVGGWTDNAFDTQRRRGERATVRNVWPA